MGFGSRARVSFTFACAVAYFPLPSPLHLHSGYTHRHTQRALSIHLNIVSILPLFWSVFFVFFDSALIDRARCFSICVSMPSIYRYVYIVVRSFFSLALPFPFQFAWSCCHYLIYFASLVCVCVSESARVKKGFHFVVYICR